MKEQTLSDESRKIHVSRLCNDESGESHFVDEMMEATAEYFCPPAPPVYVSARVSAKRVVYLFIPQGWDGVFHPAPRRQIMTLISGSLETRASDGEIRCFTPGSTLLVEDTSGKGHYTMTFEDCVLVVSQLD